MDDVVLRSMAKWPDVPAVHGWLSLDRRGQWRLQGDVIAHAKSVAFIGRNYQRGDDGAWFFQNGPQRVFVSLECTPIVYFLVEGADQIATHTGVLLDTIDALYLDENGALLIDAAAGPGLLYDPDLVTALEWMQVESRDENDLEAALEAPERAGELGLYMLWGGTRIPVVGIDSASAPLRFQFVQDPQSIVPPDAQDEAAR